MIKNELKVSQHELWEFQDQKLDQPPSLIDNTGFRFGVRKFLHGVFLSDLTISLHFIILRITVTVPDRHWPPQTPFSFPHWWALLIQKNEAVCDHENSNINHLYKTPLRFYFKLYT